MSTLKLNGVQIGQSVTATNNFTIYQPTVPDGTVRIGNGNIGTATDRITIDASGNISPGVTNTQTLGIPGDVWSNVHTNAVTATGDIQATSYNGGQLAGLRNKIINGGCQIAQRGTVSITNNQLLAYGGADRIACAIGFSTSGSGTLQRGATNLFSTGYAQNLVLTSVGTGAVSFAQRIEALNTQGLNSKQITISCKVWQNSGSTLLPIIQIGKATASDNFATVSTIGTSSGTSCLTSTLTTLTYTLTLGSTDATNGLQVLVNFPSVGAVSGAFFYIGELQLELGPVATPFEQRPYGMELALCQRYYVNYGTFHVGMYGTTNAQGDAALPVTMRATPSLTWTDSAGTANQFTVWSGTTNNTTLAGGGFSSGVQVISLDAITTYSSTASTWLRAYNVKLSAELL